MSAKHTPGPWEACEPGDYGDFDGESRVVCSADPEDMRRIAVVHWHKGYPETEANARLIAAAPDLLEALHTLVNYEGHGVWCGHGNDWDRPCVCGLNKAHDRACAAIAKAKGGAA